MKKVAYLVTGNAAHELFGGCLLNSLTRGTHGAQVVAMHFADNGVYFLTQGTATAEKIARAMQEQGVRVLACECSVKNRGLEDAILPGVPLGHFEDFYQAAETADHIIAL